jgi:hypothetical protein
MPRMKRETFQAGDMSWLDSPHGINNARTDLLDVSTFTVTDGFIKSGTPVAKVGGVLVPYVSAEGTTTNAGVLYGHVLTDQAVVGTSDFAVPVFKHGRVITAKVPAGADAFTAPVAAAKRGTTTIDYV